LNDTNYGELALKHMIDIYLEATNPAAPIPEDSASNSSLQTNSGLLIAQKLLSDNLKGDIHSLLKQSLYHRVLVASRQKNEIERTIPEMQTLVEKQPNFAPGVLALGSAFLALKQNQRAKNVFQSLIKTEWPFEFAQDYEKCFLYLADIQIQYSKFDAAMECFKLCIGYNQACSKAYEGLGFLMEREASYANAAGLYEQAWKHLRENDPALGFKLAYCYLKCKKYVEAIVVCHKILKDYPSYPRLKKEILDKARSLIRQPV
jgi:tetratricopeptide repeat protein 21B